MMGGGSASADDGEWTGDLFEEPQDFRPPSPTPTTHVVPRVRADAQERDAADTGRTAFELRLVGRHSLWVRSRRPHRCVTAQGACTRAHGRPFVCAARAHARGQAHCLWNAGVILAQHLDAHPEVVRHKRSVPLAKGGVGARLLTCWGTRAEPGGFPAVFWSWALQRLCRRWWPPSMARVRSS